MMISPTLACANYLKLQSDIEAMDRAGTDFYHIDVMDGHYVPNVCLNFDFIKAVKSISNTPMDVHLMVTNPMDYVGRLADCGVEYVSAHAGVLKDNAEYFVDKVHRHSMKAGLVLSLEDSVSSVVPWISVIDYVMVMLVRPGFSGQTLNPQMISKIRELKQIREEGKRHFLIEADGGIGWDHIGILKEAGADVAVAGVFAVFNQEESLYDATVRFKRASDSGWKEEK